jgi:nitrate reductase NapAB chaperone NapD
MTNEEWSVSGLCITAWPERMAAVEEMLNDRPGLEIYARDPQTGRLIAVQECATIEEHRQRLRELQSLPGVLTADLVLHYEDPGGSEELTTRGASQ